MCASSTSVLSSTLGRRNWDEDRLCLVPFARATPGSSMGAGAGGDDCPSDLMTSPYMDLMAAFCAGVIVG